MKTCGGRDVHEYIRIHLVRIETGEHGNILVRYYKMLEISLLPEKVLLSEELIELVHYLNLVPQTIQDSIAVEINDSAGISYWNILPCWH